ncbi:MAG: VOC family protein, partial [Pseudomonadales bacterium]
MPVSAERRFKPRAADLAYLRFAAPDLDAMSSFLIDFGLQVSASISDSGVPVLYGRGTDGSPYCYVVEQGEPRFIGMGFCMGSEEDLLALAEFDGSTSLAELNTPGGGRYVRFIDPQGYEVDGLFGWNLAEATPPAQRSPLNFGEQRERKDIPVRLTAGPSRVKRIGHCVVFVKDFRGSEIWYKQRFGFLTSDEIFAGSKDKVIGAFMRCDQGEKPVDHHTVFLLGVADKAPGLQHAAFEVNDWDDLMLGHDHLVSKGYEHHWGIGKHIMGSQVFDYWVDPFGNSVEHFTDGDLFSASV